MSEHWSGPYTEQYVAYQGRYFTRIVDARPVNVDYRAEYTRPYSTGSRSGDVPRGASHAPADKRGR